MVIDTLYLLYSVYSIYHSKDKLNGPKSVNVCYHYCMAWKHVLCAEQIVIHWILLSTLLFMKLQTILTLLITVVQSFSLNFRALFSKNVVGNFLRNIVHVTMSFVNYLIVFSLAVFCVFFIFLIVFSFLLSFYDE